MSKSSLCWTKAKRLRQCYTLPSVRLPSQRRQTVLLKLWLAITRKQYIKLAFWVTDPPLPDALFLASSSRSSTIGDRVWLDRRAIKEWSRKPFLRPSNHSVHQGRKMRKSHVYILAGARGKRTSKSYTCSLPRCGKSAVKVVPTPLSLSIQSRPPCASTSTLTTGSTMSGSPNPETWALSER